MSPLRHRLRTRSQAKGARPDRPAPPVLARPWDRHSGCTYARRRGHGCRSRARRRWHLWGWRRSRCRLHRLGDPDLTHWDPYLDRSVFTHPGIGRGPVPGRGRDVWRVDCLGHIMGHPARRGVGGGSGTPVLWPIDSERSTRSWSSSPTPSTSSNGSCGTTTSRLATPARFRRFCCRR